MLDRFLFSALSVAVGAALTVLVGLQRTDLDTRMIRFIAAITFGGVGLVGVLLHEKLKERANV